MKCRPTISRPRQMRISKLEHALISSPCQNLAFGSRICETAIQSVGAPRDQTIVRQFLRGFPPRPVIRHATPRTVTVGDVALYNALFGPRFAVQSADTFAQAIGYPRARSTTFWCFISCSARRCRTSRSMPSPISAMPPAGFWARLSRRHAQCGLGGDRAQGELQPQDRHRLCALARLRPDGTQVLDYVRWVMVRKRDENAPAPGKLPRLPKHARCPASATLARRSTPPPMT